MPDPETPLVGCRAIAGTEKPGQIRVSASAGQLVVKASRERSRFGSALIVSQLRSISLERSRRSLSTVNEYLNKPE